MRTADAPVGASRCGPMCINSVNAVRGRPNLRSHGSSGAFCSHSMLHQRERAPESRHLSNACHCAHHVLAPRVHDLGPQRKGLPVETSNGGVRRGCNTHALGVTTCFGCDWRGVQLGVARAAGGWSRSDAPEKAPLEVRPAGPRGSVLLRLCLHHACQSRVHLARAARLSSGRNARSSRLSCVFMQRCVP